MKKLITKNDIWRLLGLVLVIAGQFFHKETFSGFGVSAETNLVQITGAILLLVPFVFRFLALKKESNTDIQG